MRFKNTWTKAEKTDENTFPFRLEALSGKRVLVDSNIIIYLTDAVRLCGPENSLSHRQTLGERSAKSLSCRLFHERRRGTKKRQRAKIRKGQKKSGPCPAIGRASKASVRQGKKAPKWDQNNLKLFPPALPFCFTRSLGTSDRLERVLPCRRSDERHCRISPSRYPSHPSPWMFPKTIRS